MHPILAVKARKDGVHPITFDIIQWPIWRRRHIQSLHPFTQSDESSGYPCCSTELVMLFIRRPSIQLGPTQGAGAPRASRNTPAILLKQKRKARTSFNPRTQQKIKIPAKTVVKFRVAKAAKDGILGVKK
jgi:hypothetical protein